MIVVHSTSVDYNSILYECFSTDKDLIELWHIESGNGLDACVIRSCMDFELADVIIYELKDNDTLVGYFGIENDNFLTGFFLKPEYRTSNYVKEFWSIVDSCFSCDYLAGVYNKNIPAINFLGRKALDRFSIPELDATVFIIKKENLCQ